MPENIAQLEFFLYKADNIESIWREVEERAIDGARIKLVVRIFDISGLITAQTVYTKACDQEFDEFVKREYYETPTASRLRCWWMARRRRKLGQKERDAKKHLLELALGALEDTLRGKGDVGLELYPGAPFRLVRDNERHELLQTSRRALGVWVFVFKPNELLSDSNTMIAWAA